MIYSGLEIKKFRKINDLTQELFAEMIGVSVRTIVSYEKGDKIPKSKQKIIHSTIQKYQEDSGILEYEKSSENKNEDFGQNPFQLIDKLSSYNVPDEIVQGLRNEVSARDQKITEVQDKLIKVFEKIDEHFGRKG